MNTNGGSILKTMGTGQGYLKAGFLGFAKSGKTWTAKELAIGTRELFNLDGPIAMFDTEGGSEYIAPDILARTGKNLVGVRARSLTDLLQTLDECITAGVSVLIVDSITHVWAEVQESYMQQMNAGRERRGWRPRRDLEFQDWAALKKTWGVWPDRYLNSEMHIIICGRAGDVYEFEPRNDGSDKKDLVKKGVKMKVEKDFGYEASLLIKMERIDGNTGKEFFHRATVLGDRFGVIDASTTTDNPTFDFFRPHVELLKPGAHAPVDTEAKTDHGIDEEGDAEYIRARRERKIVLEEIQGEIVRKWPGMSAKEKATKADLLERHFGTRSWTKVEGMPVGSLRAMLDGLRLELRDGEDPPEQISEDIDLRAPAKAAETDDKAEVA